MCIEVLCMHQLQFQTTVVSNYKKKHITHILLPAKVRKTIRYLVKYFGKRLKCPACRY